MPLVPISTSAASFTLLVSSRDIDQFVGLERTKTCVDAALSVATGSRPHAIEHREIGAGIDEARDALELGAVPARHR